MMVDPLTGGINETDHQMLSTIGDIRAADRARMVSMINRSWLNRLFRHFPKIANQTIDINIDWPGRLPNTALITLRNRRRYLYTSDPAYDYGTIEEV